MPAAPRPGWHHPARSETVPGALYVARRARGVGLSVACQSKLLRARPQAVSSAVASRATAWALAREDSFICPCGSPFSAEIPTRLEITSPTPEMLAQPPQTRIFSGCSRPEPEAR